MAATLMALDPPSTLPLGWGICLPFKRSYAFQLGLYVIYWFQISYLRFTPEIPIIGWVTPKTE